MQLTHFLAAFYNSKIICQRGTRNKLFIILKSTCNISKSITGPNFYSELLSTVSFFTVSINFFAFWYYRPRTPRPIQTRRDTIPCGSFTWKAPSVFMARY